MLKIIAAALAGLSLTACAMGTTNISLAKAPIARPALLAEAPSRMVAITQITDSRDETMRDRIGDKRNGYGMVMGKIGTTEPVPDVVKKVLTDTFTANKHKVVTDAAGANVKVDAEITKFWFDYKVGLVTVEFFADAQVRMSVKDANNAEIFKHDFKGYASEKTAGGLSDVWTRVMDAALADLSREISLSTDLKAALEKANQNLAAAAGQPAS
ncbi:MAG TPA: hypothetical protein VIA80_07050 [Hyphomonadaceae bacterium]|jgi:hypothetical protein